MFTIKCKKEVTMKQDLYNALRLIKDYCTNRTSCVTCPIKDWCQGNEEHELYPEKWNLEEE